MEKQSNPDTDPRLNVPPGKAITRILLVLAVLAGLTAFAVIKGLNISALVLMFFGLSLVIFIHELGHFLAAKWSDVHVETFSIGLGPSVPGCQFQWGETTYKLGCVPLGGYVKMVGEGADSEEGEDDPRSYRNKPVGQKMLIISAGVIMNMLLAVVCFIGVFMLSGIERHTGVVGLIDAGSPAWQAGLRSGSLITRIGNKSNPSFDKIRPAVVLSGAGEKIDVDFKDPAEHDHAAKIEPKFDEEDAGMPLIGVSPSTTTRLRDPRGEHGAPVVAGTPAAEVYTEFKDNDIIVATTDPSDPSGKLLDLPEDWRHPGSGKRDFHEFYRRSVILAGQPMKVAVERDGVRLAKPITLPPAFARDLGMQMKMGEIVAVRDGSDAAKKGVEPQLDASKGGDTITRVEVANPKGGVIRFVYAISKGPPAEGVEERPLDPIRLPFELEEWAKSATAPKIVRLTILGQKNHNEANEREVEVEWDDNWRFAREVPFAPRSPTSIPGLGIAYKVKSTIVRATGAAAAAGLKPDDEITGVLYYDATPGGTPEAKKRWQEVKPDQWAHVAYNLNERLFVYGGRVDFKVKRRDKVQEVSLTLDTDPTWPIAGRGLVFEDDMRLQKADSVGQAIAMGYDEEVETALNIYVSLKRMVVDRRISFNKNANGPLSIGMTAYHIAGTSLPGFVWFLAILSVNLAVINFLPIPVLDGGHMVFLLYEKFVGRAAPEFVSRAATFAGVALLFSLMLYVIVLDVMRLFF